MASRTRWPCFCRPFPKATKGWTSPRLPTTWMTMFSRKGNCSGVRYRAYVGGGAAVSGGGILTTTFDRDLLRREFKLMSMRPSSASWVSIRSVRKSVGYLVIAPTFQRSASADVFKNGSAFILVQWWWRTLLLRVSSHGVVVVVHLKCGEVLGCKKSPRNGPTCILYWSMT